MPGITDPTEAYFKDGQWGWDGTQWRKQPLVWAYSERLAEQVYDLTTDAPAETLVSATPDPGEVWVVQAISAFNAVSDPTNIRIGLLAGAILVHLYDQDPGGISAAAMWQGELVLANGDVVQAKFSGCVNGDDIYLRVWGYKMAIAE